MPQWLNEQNIIYGTNILAALACASVLGWGGFVAYGIGYVVNRHALRWIGVDD